MAQLSSHTEEEFGKRLDRCLTDMIIKGSSGLLVGSVISVLLFKRRAWPLLVGTGFGIGVSYRSCETALKL